LQDRPQRLQRLARLDLVRSEASREQAGTVGGLLVRERNVTSIVRLHRKRDTADFTLHRIDRARLQLDCEVAGVAGTRDPGVEIGKVADRLVLSAIERGLARLLGTRSGERLGCAFEACGLVASRVGRLVRCAPTALEG
jgi:hypothetical protein